MRSNQPHFFCLLKSVFVGFILKIRLLYFINAQQIKLHTNKQADH